MTKDLRRAAQAAGDCSFPRATGAVADTAAPVTHPALRPNSANPEFAIALDWIADILCHLGFSDADILTTVNFIVRLANIRTPIPPICAHGIGEHVPP